MWSRNALESSRQGYKSMRKYAGNYPREIEQQVHVRKHVRKHMRAA